MKVSSNSFENGGAIPTEFAFGKHDPKEHIALSDNQNPHLAWHLVPEGTQSFAVICHDPEVPSVPDDVNQEGKTVPYDLPRVDFYHWVLIDLPAGTTEISAGEFSSGVTPKGKEGPGAPRGARQGLNNYTQWFEGDAEMEGQYFGYDGPCPPWNDERVHRYIFTVYALDVPKLDVEGPFTGPDARKAMEGHILAEANITGTYTINPDAK